MTYLSPTRSPKSILYKMALLVVGIFVVNSFALQFSWYWVFWWFDMPMHFLGGLFLGGLSLYIYSHYVLKNNQKKWSLYRWFRMVLLFVLSFGVLWEFYEFFIDYFLKHTDNNILDTLSDVFFDTAGGMSAFLYFLIRSTEVE